MQVAIWNSYHAGGIHVLLCDGAVKFLSDNLDHAILLRLAARADGEVVSEF